MLTRYWFVIHPQDRYGVRNIGVTASTRDEAKQIISNALAKKTWTELSEMEIN